MENFEWQPMDSAPKDGQKVNILWNSFDGMTESIAAWNGEMWISDKVNWLNGFPIICRRPLGWKNIIA